MYYVGVDLGGTNIKVGICDGEGNILKKGSIKTGAERSADRLPSRWRADAAAYLRDGADGGGYHLRGHRDAGYGGQRTASSCTAATCRFWSIRWRSASPILRGSAGC